jgi:hypothetical protein
MSRCIPSPAYLAVCHLWQQLARTTSAANDGDEATHVATAATSTAKGSIRYLHWRASFALQLHTVFEMKPDVFPRLAEAILGVSITTLRLLQQQFWQTESVELFIDILVLVKRAGLGKHLIITALQGWPKQPMALITSATSESELRQQTLALFVERIQTHLGKPRTKQLVRNQQALLSEAERAQLLAPSLSTAAACQIEPEMASQDDRHTALEFELDSTTSHEQVQPAAAASSAAAASPASSRSVSIASHPRQQDDRPYWERQVDIMPIDMRKTIGNHRTSSRHVSRHAATAQDSLDSCMSDQDDAVETCPSPSVAAESNSLPPPLPPPKLSEARSSKRKHPSTTMAITTAVPATRQASKSTSSSPNPSTVSVKRMRKEASSLRMRTSLRSSALSAMPASTAAAESDDDSDAPDNHADSDMYGHAKSKEKAEEEEEEKKNEEEDVEDEADVDDGAEEDDDDDVDKGGEEMQPLAPLEFADDLREAAPYHEAIASRLRADDMAIVQPCFREHVTWLRELNVDLLKPSSFQHGYRMSLSCFGDGGGEFVPLPQDKPRAHGLHASPRVSAPDVFAFLEAEWQHCLQPMSSSAPEPLAGTTDRIYLKDLSQQHDIKTNKTTNSKQSSDKKDELNTFFPHWDHVLKEYDAGCEQRSAAATLCATRQDTPAEEQAGSCAAAAMQYKEKNFPALFLDAYARHPQSLLRLASGFCDGVSNSFAYLKHGFQFFRAHVEQCLMPFVHHQLSGQSVWIIVACRDREKLLAVTHEMAQTRSTSNSASAAAKKRAGGGDQDALVTPIWFYSKSLFPPLSLLVKHGIRYRRVLLEAGQMLLAHGGCAHYGFSTQAGETYSFACNILDEHWLVAGGPEFVLQFFEWVSDLADLHADKDLQCRLAAYGGLSEHHLAAALNTCPPAYTCCLLKAIRTDLQTHVAWCMDPVAVPAPRVHYTLAPDDVRIALANLDDALAVLHQPNVRQLYQRFCTSKGDSSSSAVCPCKEEKNDEPQLVQLEENKHCASPYALHRLHSCMERIHCLVVGSGQGVDETDRSKTRSGKPSVAGVAAAASPKAFSPISTTFGSVTASPLSRLLDFLTNGTAVRPSLRLSKGSRFIDVGSGIGQVVLHVQLRCALAACIGIEPMLDRCEAADATLAQFQLQRQKSTEVDPRYIVPGLDEHVLDDRLDRVRFERGCIEDRLDLLDGATHVFMFDSCFHPSTHSTLLPRLCAGPPRIVVTCLTRRRMQHCWPTPISMDNVRRRFRFLRKMPLTLAGSRSTRTVFVYQTAGQSE